MTYEEYKILSLKRQSQIMMVADCNTIVDKLTRWENREKDNPAWKKCPSLSSGANRDDRIFDDIPYSVGLSDYTSSLLEELANILKLQDGERIKCPIELIDTEILPLLSITTQFGILEYFEVELYRSALSKGKLYYIDTEKFTLKDISSRGLETMFEGRVKALTDSYSLKGIRKRVTASWNAIGITQMSEEDVKTYTELADRRNELTHEIKCTPPTLEEAKKYYEDCLKIAKIIFDSFNQENSTPKKED